MKEKKECKIIQDLLPSYIENLTTVETNEYIQAHLNECKECKKALEDMQKELKTQAFETDKNKVNYIKKYNKKMKALKIVLSLILLAFIIVVGRRTAIIVSLSNKAKEYQKSDNYYARMYQYEGNTIATTEIYHKKEKEVAIDSHWASDGTSSKLTKYKDENKINVYIEAENDKVALLDVKKDGTFPMMKAVNYMKLNNIFELMLNAITCPVKTTKCNGKECYYFSNWYNSNMIVSEGDSGIYIDKETGLPVRAAGGTVGSNAGIKDVIIDYEFEFDNVKDEDLKEPDVSNYRIEANN